MHVAIGDQRIEGQADKLGDVAVATRREGRRFRGPVPGEQIGRLTPRRLHLDYYHPAVAVPPFAFMSSAYVSNLWTVIGADLTAAELNIIRSTRPGSDMA